MLAGLLTRMRNATSSSISSGGVRTLYVASNKPSAVRRQMEAIRAAIARAGFRSLLVRGWHDLLASGKEEEEEAAADEGLRAALVEHELCTLAPAGFAGSTVSTWANLIGARRWVAGHRDAYRDVHTGALVPACAAHGGLAPELQMQRG